MKKGEVYKHFKGHIVYIVDIAADSETLEEVAIYHHLFNDDTKLWVRPVKMFFDDIDPNRDGNITKQNKRFIKIEELKDTQVK